MEKETCRDSISCSSKVWYINDVPYVLGKSPKELVVHICKTTPVSNCPETVYIGVWKNARTGNVRYGPLNKKEENARKPPDRENRWELMHVLWDTLTWKTMEDKTTVYTSGYNSRFLRKRNDDFNW